MDDSNPRPSDPDDVFETANGIDPDEFGDGRIPSLGQATPPRPAATIILARQSSGTESVTGFEVLLLRRPRTTGFAPGAYVFAGGTIDRADSAAEMTHRLAPSLSREEMPALVAALRELFEETGILLADQELSRHREEKARADLLGERSTFAEIAAALDLTFRNLRAAYMARWITPRPLRRRYDTRFFLAEASGSAARREPQLTQELTRHVWLPPADAVRRCAEGSLPMLFPTRTTLQHLSRFTDLESAIAAYQSRPVELVEPRLVIDGDEIRPVLPGQPGYEDAD